MSAGGIQNRSVRGVHADSEPVIALQAVAVEPHDKAPHGGGALLTEELLRISRNADDTGRRPER